MITQIDIANFRSIKQQSIKLKKLNILYGPNGSGKSSVANAPYVMRNFMVNPNQRLDSLFNLGFINLGSFENVVRNNNAIEISIHKKETFKNILKDAEEFDCKYNLELSEDELFGSNVSYDLGFGYKGIIPINHPYTLINKEFAFDNLKLIWNGLTFQVFDDRCEKLSTCFLS